MSSSEVAKVEQWLDAFLWPEEEEKQRAKRERILGAATALFVRLGYRKTSIDDVARGAGVAKGTVYLYYRNKAELLFHAAALEKRAYVAGFSALLDASIPAADRLAGLIELGLARVTEMPLLARLASGDGELALAMAEVDVSVLERVNAWQTGFMLDLLDEATGGTRTREDLTARAQVLVDLVSAILSAPRTASRAQPVGQYTRLMANTLVHGVLAPPGDPTLASPMRGVTTEPASAQQRNEREAIR
ncbi:MAG: helix-turn-helix domain-containing protein [Pseudomonadales bacterium]|jgi:AcrR family transcriptional regulator